MAGAARKRTNSSIPQSVKEAIGRRLNRLSEPTVDALRTAARAGQESSRSGNWPRCRRRGDDALLDALDEAERAQQLIRANAGGPGASSAGGDDSFAFTHDKIREVLLRGAEPDSPPSAASAHRRDAGDTARRSVRTARRGGRTTTRRTSRTTSCRPAICRGHSTYARRAARQCRAGVRARRGAQVPGAGARVRRGAASRTTISRDRRADRRHSRCRGTTHPAVESFQRALARGCQCPRRARRSTPRSARRYCAIGDARGLPYLERALARTRSTDPGRTRWRWPRRRWAAIITIEPSTPRRSSCSSARGSWPSRSTTRRRCAIIYIVPRGRPSAPAELRRKRSLGARGIALGERKKFPQADAPAATSSWRKTPQGRGHWDDVARLRGDRDRDEGRKSARRRASAWSQVLQRVGAARQGRARRRPRHGASRIGAVRSDRRSFAWLTWLAPVVATDCGGPGR